MSYGKIVICEELLVEWLHLPPGTILARGEQVHNYGGRPGFAFVAWHPGIPDKPPEFGIPEIHPVFSKGDDGKIVMQSWGD